MCGFRTCAGSVRYMNWLACCFDSFSPVISPAQAGDECRRIESAIGEVRLDLLQSIERIEKNMGSENELIDEIGEAIMPFRKKQLMVRLLDIGGDKHLPYLPHAREANPFLGKRGVRLLLENPSLLEVQLRALVRLFQNQEIRILIPMVTVAEDVRQLRKMLQKVAGELGSQSQPELCSMVETPAAALCAAEIAAVSDSLNKVS